MTSQDTRPMIYVHFSRPRHEVEGPTFGPFDFVQQTYEGLRYGPDGANLAFIHDGEWFIGETREPIPDSKWANIGARSNGEPFSDFTIYAGQPENGEVVYPLPETYVNDPATREREEKREWIE